jgi:17beta-estradiol 17-dehydrogenase / very-long-chain 3-oxoacyl-CoA reductase
MFTCDMCAALATAFAILIAISFFINVVLPSLLVGDSKVLKGRLNKSGKAWAIVTGTTSGIGYAFVLALTKLGFNVLMISRNEQKLKEIKQESSNKNKSVKVEYLVMDLGKKGGDIVSPELKKFIAVNEVSILINNAGLNTDFPKLYIDNTTEEIESIIDVNSRSVCLLTREVLPSMVHRRSGLVINVSSLFGQLSGPLVSVYSGTKSFIDSFSASLSEEIRGTGVSCFVSLPGFVISNMSKLKRTSLTVITADDCVNSILKQCAGGYLNAASPHWSHSAISWALTKIVPSFITSRLLGRINRGTNRAALRKIARESK